MAAKTVTNAWVAEAKHVGSAYSARVKWTNPSPPPAELEAVLQIEAEDYTAFVTAAVTDGAKLDVTYDDGTMVPSSVSFHR